MFKNNANIHMQTYNKLDYKDVNIIIYSLKRQIYFNAVLPITDYIVRKLKHE